MQRQKRASPEKNRWWRLAQASGVIHTFTFIFLFNSTLLTSHLLSHAPFAQCGSYFHICIIMPPVGVDEGRPRASAPRRDMISRNRLPATSTIVNPRRVLRTYVRYLEVSSHTHLSAAAASQSPLDALITFASQHCCCPQFSRLAPEQKDAAFVPDGKT